MIPSPAIADILLAIDELGGTVTDRRLAEHLRGHATGAAARKSRAALADLGMIEAPPARVGQRKTWSLTDHGRQTIEAVREQLIAECEA